MSGNNKHNSSNSNAANNAMWLQESVHMPDLLGGNDDEELRLLHEAGEHLSLQQQRQQRPHHNNNGSSAASASQPFSQRAPIPALSAMSRDDIAAPGRAYGSTTTTAGQQRYAYNVPSAYSSAPSTPRDTPTSSLPMPRNGRMSIASADFQLQQRNSQLVDDMKQNQTRLQDTLEELELHKKLLKTEKDSSERWKQRYQDQVTQSDQRCEEQLEKLRAIAIDRDEAVEAARRVECDFAAFKSDAERTTQARVAEATRALQQRTDKLAAKAEALEAQLDAAQQEAARRTEYIGELREEAEKLRDTLAFSEEELRVTREDAERLQRAADDVRVELESQHRAYVAQLQEAHAVEMRQAANHHMQQLEQVQAESTEAVSAARQRASHGEQARDELRRAHRELAEVRDELAAKEEDMGRLREQHSHQRRRAEAEHGEAAAALERAHELAIAALIEEHNQERATLRQRLSQGEAAGDRAARMEAALAAERERTDLLQSDVDMLRQQLEESRRALARREEALAEATARATETEARVAEVEDAMSTRLSSERQNLHERIEQLLGQIEVLNRERNQEADSYADQLSEARRRQSDAEALLAEQRTSHTKERMAMMKAEAALREELSEAIEQRDEATRARRQFDQKLDGAIADVQALERRLHQSEALRIEAEQREKAARRAESQYRSDADAGQSYIESLKARIATLEMEAAARRETAAEEEQRRGHVAAAQQPQQPQQQNRYTAQQQHHHHDDEDQRFDAMMPAPHFPSKGNLLNHLRSAAPSPSPAPCNPFTVALADLEPVGARKGQFLNARQGTAAGGVKPSQPLDVTPRAAGGPLSPSNANAAPFASVDGKRHRSEERQNTVQRTTAGSAPSAPARRVFAATGFDQSHNVLDVVRRLGHAETVDAAANSAIPTSVTHLITSGQMTVKLLTALVRGAWVLPKSYLVASEARGEWESEASYGFRHRRPILKGRPFMFSEAFKACRHFDTARLVAAEGGADLRLDVPVDEVTCQGEGAVLLCTPQELRSVRAMLEGSPTTPLTWDGMVKLIYPPNVISFPQHD